MMRQGSEFRELSQSVVGKEMRMRVEHFFRSLSYEGEGSRSEGWGKGDVESWHPEGTVSCHQINQNGKEVIRWTLRPSPSNLLKYLAAIVYKKIHRHI